MRFAYAIKFVSDMDRAVAFHRDVLKLHLKFESPVWSEFETGEVTLALHPASEASPPGSVQLGFRAEDIDAVYAGRDEAGLVFTQPPTPQHGQKLARFLDSEGAECSLGG